MAHRSPLLLAATLFASVLLLVLAAVLSPVLRADETTDEAGDGAPVFERAPDPRVEAGPDADLFVKGVSLQAKGKYVSARRLFWKLIDTWPDSPYASEANDRSADNAFLGFTRMNAPRPSARRIDVALMGDGYLFQQQTKFNKAAVGHLKVLLREPTLAEYEPYFQFWRFNLASKETGVDEVQRTAPDEEREARRKRRKKRPAREFSTALDCKAAGPQGQVMADASRVWHYLSYLEENDGLAVVFAKRGRLGMGGMGIATTGPKGVVVHEFGHAFSGLLDEYANNPGEPFGVVESANTTTHWQRPPWQHFLDAKIPGVGVYEGAATFKHGVWRPARGCAMNTGGNVYCPVCREATVLMIYTYVSPIDEVRPARSDVVLSGDTRPDFVVVPMQPATHDLDVEFYLDDAPPAPKEGVAEKTPEDRFADDMLTERERKIWERIKKRREAEGRRQPLPLLMPGQGGRVRRGMGTGRDERPRGVVLRAKRRKKGGRRMHTAVLPAVLAPGRHHLTAVVRDDTLPRGEAHPWVLEDDRGLLEDRWTWVLVVPDPQAAPEGTPPKAGG